MTDFTVVQSIVFDVTGTQPSITADIIVESARVIDGTVTVVEPPAPVSTGDLVFGRGPKGETIIVSTTTGEERPIYGN
jgi:hypothetical protein